MFAYLDGDFLNKAVTYMQQRGKSSDLKSAGKGAIKKRSQTTACHELAGPHDGHGMGLSAEQAL